VAGPVFPPRVLIRVAMLWPQGLAEPVAAAWGVSHAPLVSCMTPAPANGGAPADSLRGPAGRFLTRRSCGLKPAFWVVGRGVARSSSGGRRVRRHFLLLPGPRLSTPRLEGSAQLAGPASARVDPPPGRSLARAAIAPPARSAGRKGQAWRRGLSVPPRRSLAQGRANVASGRACARAWRRSGGRLRTPLALQGRSRRAVRGRPSAPGWELAVGLVAALQLHGGWPAAWAVAAGAKGPVVARRQPRWVAPPASGIGAQFCAGLCRVSPSARPSLVFTGPAGGGGLAWPPRRPGPRMRLTRARSAPARAVARRRRASARRIRLCPRRRAGCPQAQGGAAICAGAQALSASSGLLLSPQLWTPSGAGGPSREVALRRACRAARPRVARGAGAGLARPAAGRRQSRDGLTRAGGQFRRQPRRLRQRAFGCKCALRPAALQPLLGGPGAWAGLRARGSAPASSGLLEGIPLARGAVGSCRPGLLPCVSTSDRDSAP